MLFIYLNNNFHVMAFNNLNYYAAQFVDWIFTYDFLVTTQNFKITFHTEIIKAFSCYIFYK